MKRKKVTPYMISLNKKKNFKSFFVFFPFCDMTYTTTTTSTTAVVLYRRLPTTVALYHRIPVVPSDRYYFIRQNLIWKCQLMDYEYLDSFLLPLSSDKLCPVENDDIAAENCWTKVRFRRDGQKTIHYVLESDNLSFDMATYVDDHKITLVDSHEILPCLKCSFFRWNSFRSVKSCYVFHLLHRENEWSYFFEDSGTQDITKWHLKSLWYQDYHIMNFYFSLLPEEVFNEILDDFLTKPKKSEQAKQISFAIFCDWQHKAYSIPLYPLICPLMYAL
jgi:hypothetical protein